MKYKQWSVAAPQPEGAQRLVQAGIPPLLSTILAARGISDEGEALRLLDPLSNELHDPMLLRDMDKAVSRIRQAIDKNELIAVYGDYDVDGITSTCLLTEFFRARGGKVLPYIPDRLEEGYGLNYEAIDYLSTQNVKLIVTVDCGITAVNEVMYAKEKGIEVVITDHHACKETLPPAVAVVDPHHPDCPYPFKGLAGVGVALKLAMAVAEPEEREEVFDACCDLAAIGTVADVMPMTGENRLLVRSGLNYLNPARRLGLAQLIRSAGLEEKGVTAVSVGYTLAPRINASGRMGRARVALELLLSRDAQRAEELAEELCSLNRERQGIESDIFTQCSDHLEQHPQSGIVLLASPGWHQGVVGIVASRLAEKFACPAFMICLENGVGKGSCRSWGGVNLFQLLQQSADLLENFGGHALAAGFTVKEENIPALTDALRRGVVQFSQGQELPSVLDIDAAVTPEMLTLEDVEALDLLEPCGSGNPRPVLVLTGAQVQSMIQVGRGRHLKMRLESKGHMMESIFFSTDGAQLGLHPGCRVDVAFYPNVNEFRGTRCVQLQIVDLKLAPSRAQLELAIFDKYRRGKMLDPAEARFLLPERREFVDLWRWLERQSIHSRVVEDTPARIARSVSRSMGGGREVPARTMLCLDVLAERGLISVNTRIDRLQITIHKPAQKVDLEASCILIKLREQSR